MSQRKIQANVFRFDPSYDVKPHFQTYEVVLMQGMTVLDVLDYIYEKLDCGLAYYSHAACRHGICGYCNLIINGRPSLACQTLVQGDISIKPLPKFEIIRDLVYRRWSK